MEAAAPSGGAEMMPIAASAALRDHAFKSAAGVLRTMHRVATGDDRDPVPLWPKNHQGQPRGQFEPRAICIELAGNIAAVWSPKDGFTTVRLDLDLEVRSALALARSASAQLAAITRRAFMPSVMVQIYQTNPLLQLMAPGRGISSQ
jgi:hypothetical protein